MRVVLRWLKSAFLGPEKPPLLDEDRFPLDANRRPDLTRFTKSVAEYERYIGDFIASIDDRAASRPPEHLTSEWMAYEYRKNVFGHWGLIARGPGEALPTVLRLLRHPVAEARQAGAGVLDAWARDNRELEAPALAAAERELALPEPDIETLGVLMDVLARRRSEAALPLMARVLRDPRSSNGDLDWSAIESLGVIAGRTFAREPEPKQAADRWLRERGL